MKNKVIIARNLVLKTLGHFLWRIPWVLSPYNAMDAWWTCSLIGSWIFIYSFILLALYQRLVSNISQLRNNSLVATCVGIGTCVWSAGGALPFPDFWSSIHVSGGWFIPWSAGGISSTEAPPRVCNFSSSVAQPSLLFPYLSSYKRRSLKALVLLTIWLMEQLQLLNARSFSTQSIPTRCYVLISINRHWRIFILTDLSTNPKLKIVIYAIQGMLGSYVLFSNSQFLGDSGHHSAVKGNSLKAHAYFYKFLST